MSAAFAETDRAARTLFATVMQGRGNRPFVFSLQPKSNASENVRAFDIVVGGSLVQGEVRIETKDGYVTGTVKTGPIVTPRGDVLDPIEYAGEIR